MFVFLVKHTLSSNDNDGLREKTRPSLTLIQEEILYSKNDRKIVFTYICPPSGIILELQLLNEDLSHSL